MGLSPMAVSPTVSELKVEDYVFPSTAKPPASDKRLFLGGAGVRGLETEGKFIKFTAIGVYLEDTAIPALTAKWKGKTASELADSDEFFRDVFSGPFEKFTKVSMISPLTGQQFSEKVIENCLAIWKAIGTYTDEEAKAVDKFLEAFKPENFPPGRSINFTHSSSGLLTIAFSEHKSIPEGGNVVIKNKRLSQAYLESVIGKHGVSPAAKQSLAARISEILNTPTATSKVADDGKVEVTN